MIGSRAWWALMRRNLVYRKRNWIGTILEVLLPIGFVAILVAIKSTVGNTDADEVPAVLPGDSHVFRPLSFGDYVTALQAERRCIPPMPGKAPSITGISDQGSDWQVPMIKCDSRKCVSDEDAHAYCEYAIVAVAASSKDDKGGIERRDAFVEWLFARYPDLTDTSKMPPVGHDMVQVLTTPDMDAYVKNASYGSPGMPKIAMGIVFEGNDATNYKYQLRQNSTNTNSPEAQVLAGTSTATTTPDTGRLFRSFAKDDDHSCIPVDGTAEQGHLEDSCTGQYLYNGILTFQRLVHDFILENSGADGKYRVGEAGVAFVPFPSKAYREAGFFGDISEAVGLMLLLGLLYPVAAMIGYVTREKELGQKELIKMMSVSESDIGWSWFVTFFMLHAVTATLTTLVSVGLYEESDGFLIWIFWILTFIAVVVFSLVIAAFSSMSSRGILIGLLIFFAGIFLTFPFDIEETSSGTLGLLSLHPVAAFTFGLNEIGRLEDDGVGLTGNTRGSTDNPSGYTFDSTLKSLIFDSIFWGIVSWYSNRVIHPKYGQALPWYFPFSASYWRPRSSPSARAEEESGSAAFSVASSEWLPMEPVGEDLQRQTAEGKSIEIQNLGKQFGDKTAVDGLSMSMYSGQVTALLGHNGAGKTTAINMLTGAIAPTFGSATVAGKDIRSEMNSIRQNLGICLQHDCLFPQLTVREHVQFFSRLKGLYSKTSRAEAEEHVDQAIRDVALYEKRHALSKHLSGGMKRKLSVAMAFCGGSKVVLLDEPTAGMDPFSRRFTWNVIRQYRHDRCILLTTHFMDEADILGDRIAIMAEGRLRCTGSSLFLKKTYGVGYQLTIEKNHEQNHRGGDSAEAPRTMSNSNEEDGKLKQIVKNAVPKAALLSDVGSEISYQLPLGAASKFAPMFEALDEEVDHGQISSYGVSVTTLDEVFLLVARGETKEKAALASSLRQSGTQAATPFVESKSLRSRMDLENEGLFLRHVGALFLKRAAFFKRDKKAWCFTTILPSVFVLIGFVLFTAIAPSRNLEPTLLSLEEYNPGVQVERNPIVFNSPGEFTCQPGQCAYSGHIQEGTTGEEYFFCGHNAMVDKERACSISMSDEVMAFAFEDGARAVAADVSTINKASDSLSITAGTFEASQYGAVFFTHEDASTMDSGESYNYTVQDQCLANLGSYTSSEDCARFGGLGYVVQYNFTALHAGPLFQSLADEAIVRAALSEPNFTITSTIAPLRITGIEEDIGESEDAFMAWFLVVLSFPFITGAFASFIVQEKESKAKHLQTVAGVQPSAYWLSTYLWDIMNYQIPLWITILLMVAFDISVLTTSRRGVFGGVVTLLLLYGPASAGLTYCISHAFKSPNLCNMFVIVTGFLIGMGGAITHSVLVLIGKDSSDPQPNLVDIANVLAWILRFYPPYSLGKGLWNIIYIDRFEYLFGREMTVWDKEILRYEVIFLAWQSFVFIGLAIQLDVWSSNPRAVSVGQRIVNLICCRWLCASHQTTETKFVSAVPDDDDVMTEQERVLSGNANNDLIVMSRLTKVYSTGKVAVNNLSLGIEPGECFGLLGINGAGKTTVMSMLTAEFPPSSGDATLGGYSVSKEPEKTRRRIGYCPQFDAHFANLTGREHVELYASIKGVPKAFVKGATAAKLAEIGLSDSDSDRLSAGYSGGMKRRLSLACATIGQPHIVFLDECSTGVDPVARREIWQLVSDMVAGDNVPDDQRASVILTTHSMEECEALCPRIGIMANGRLRCLGSAQHLKNKFGQGYQIEMKVKIVDRQDEDYQQCAIALRATRMGDSDVEAEEETEEIGFTYDETIAALTSLTGDDFLSSMISGDNPIGYNIWKDTSQGGVSLDALAAFCTSELRIRNVAAYVADNFGSHVLRERQDNKVRYEVNAKGVRISQLFASIERNKEALHLSDYGVSQTSLEQVFNIHAAEAERLKQGLDDG